MPPPPVDGEVFMPVLAHAATSSSENVPARLARVRNIGTQTLMPEDPAATRLQNATRRLCHNPAHDLPQQRLRRARPRARVAPVHPDEGSRAAAPDPHPPRAGRVARGLLGPALSR